jgi:hypothetical protein
VAAARLCSRAAAQAPQPPPGRPAGRPAALPSPPGRSHILKDVRKQLYTDADDRSFVSRITAELRELDRRLEDGRAALAHLDMALSNVACDDPGTAIGSQLALPLLQERLSARAEETKVERARMAEVEIIQMEVGHARGGAGGRGAGGKRVAALLARRAAGPKS